MHDGKTLTREELIILDTWLHRELLLSVTFVRDAINQFVKFTAGKPHTRYRELITRPTKTPIVVWDMKDGLTSARSGITVVDLEYAGSLVEGTEHEQDLHRKWFDLVTLDNILVLALIPFATGQDFVVTGVFSIPWGIFEDTAS